MRKHTAKSNPYLHTIIIEAVEQQLAGGTPRECWTTLERLMCVGYTREEAIEKMATVLCEEMHDIMSNTSGYDEARYCSRLKEIV